MFDQYHASHLLIGITKYTGETPQLPPFRRQCRLGISPRILLLLDSLDPACPFVFLRILLLGHHLLKNPRSLCGVLAFEADLLAILVE